MTADIADDGPESSHRDPFQLYELGDYERALPLFKKMAEDGDPYACSMLALMYDAAQGTAFDLDAAIAWDLKSIELGNETAILNLAITHRRHGNCREARKWFEKAVALGDGEAMLELAKLLDVSDHETHRVIELLKGAMACRYNITEDGRESATALLNKVTSRQST